MKYAISIIILFLAVNLSAQDMPGMKMPMKKKAATQQTEKVIYTCPMHPEVKMDKPGNCPKCGMKLVKKTIKSSTSNAAHQMHDGMQMNKDTMPGNKNMNMPGMKMPDQSLGGDTGKVMNKSMDMGSMKMDEGKGMKMDKPVDRLLGYKEVETNLPPRTLRYDLYVRDTMVTFGKKSKRAIAVNGQIPMPTLTFTEGDTALIYVHNELNEETSLHWHGLFLPNKMDGVPFLTQMPIKPHSTYIYKFPIIQHGTHWYHSHTKFQEQIGMYGAFIMNKRKEWNIPTIPMVLSEWTDMNPKEVHRSLRAATDWFAIQKGTTQSYAEAIKTGHLKTKLTNEWKRMNAMDVSDVYYDNFLINGKNQNEQPQFKA
ncbi:MAG: multicopper oxidase domain-containing protein, partial [Ginsengibacter sp.]